MIDDKIDNATAFSIVEFIFKTKSKSKSVAQLTGISSDDVRDIRSQKKTIKEEHRAKIDKKIRDYTKEGKFNSNIYLQSIYRVLKQQDSSETKMSSGLVTLYARKLGVEILRASNHQNLLNHRLIVFRQSMVNINQFVLGRVDFQHDYDADTITCHIKITSEQFGVTCHEEFQKGLLCRNNNTLTMICESDDNKGSASFQNALFKWNVHPMSQTTNDNYISLSGDMSVETRNKKDDFSFVMLSISKEFNETFDIEENLGKIIDAHELPQGVQDSFRNHTSFKSF